MFIKSLKLKLNLYLFFFIRRFRSYPQQISMKFLEKCPQWVNHCVVKAKRYLHCVKYFFIWQKGGRWKVKNIQLEITYRCNLLCRKCNRHCNLVKLPYLKDSDMTVEQVEKFISQVKQKKAHLHQIDIIGGEPLLHPKIGEFISLIFYKLMVPGHLDFIQISSNGILKDRLNEILVDSNIKKAIDNKFIILNYVFGPKDDWFYWVLTAPVDLGLKWDRCDWPRTCGVLLNACGYWPSGICGALARLFCLDEYAKYDFPVKFGKIWPRLKEDVCKYCPVGSDALRNKTNGRVSPSYKKAINRWMKEEPWVFKKF